MAAEKFQTYIAWQSYWSNIRDVSMALDATDGIAAWPREWRQLREAPRHCQKVKSSIKIGSRLSRKGREGDVRCGCEVSSMELSKAATHLGNRSLRTERRCVNEAVIGWTPTKHQSRNPDTSFFFYDM